MLPVVGACLWETYEYARGPHEATWIIQQTYFLAALGNLMRFKYATVSDFDHNAT